MSKDSHFINDRWITGKGNALTSINPASNQEVMSCFEAGKEEIDEAVAAARQAAFHWSNLPLERRASYLKQFGQVLESHALEMAETISTETGKPLWEAKGEVEAMLAKIPLSIDAYRERCGEKILQHPVGTLHTRYKPHGVVAVFGPFNFPGHLPHGQIVPALLAGNTIVFKPSELTVKTANLTATLWQKAALPAGVFNMIQGAATTGKELAAHPGIDGLFFTGSYNTGKALNEIFSPYPQKILALEMGGNNPLIVWDTEDVEAAAYLIIQSSYLTSGQRCTCSRRLILPRSKSQPLIDRLVDMIRRIRIGAYTDRPEPFMGPVITAAAAERLVNEQAILIKRGAAPLVKMEHLDPNTGFLTPGLLDVSQVVEKEDKELFGPLLQLTYVDSFDKALEEANNTGYGLTAGIVTQDPALYHAFYRSIRAGIINWNAPTTGSSSAAPFGGVGKSGNHRPAGYFTTDFCTYPIASLETPTLKLPSRLLPGII